jgi:hypothetical protein
VSIVPSIIEPIRLLKGSHEDTAKTGQGCFMNVIAYLNGEPQITDQSPCVCVTVRPLAIMLNDKGTDEQRARLLPFVLRAMGSATKDKTVLDRRVARVRQYGAECQDLMNAWRAEMKAAYADANPDAYAYAYANANANAYAYAYAYANANANAYDAYANAYAYADAYAYAEKRAWVYAKRDELQAALFDAGLRFLDDVLPAADAPSGEVLARAERLCELAV